MTRWIAIAMFCLPVVACGAEEQPEEPVVEEPVMEEPVEEVAEAEPTADEIPIVDDFEPEAEAEITADNYVAELDTLAAEIEADDSE